jgi:hypothetical protein
MSFYYLDQNTYTDFSTLENNYSIENFESMPPIDSVNTDNNYQCSNNVQINGNTIGSTMSNYTLANCKSNCKNDPDCVGFDFDNSNLSCTLKNTITDLTSAKQNNVMCVKKTSSACSVSPQTNPQEAVQKIIGEIEQQNIIHHNSQYNSIISGVSNPVIPEFNTHLNQKSLSNMPESQKIINNKQNCKSDTIFVDLPCFLNKMDVLKNHSDNLMIDLQLLITNLKSCSYVKKTPKTQSSNNPLKPINGNSSDNEMNLNGLFNVSEQSKTISNTNIPVPMPTQDTIKVYNSPASVLYTNNPTTNANIMLGITEPFQNNEQETSFFNSFTFKMIVIFLILILIMNMK